MSNCENILPYRKAEISILSDKASSRRSVTSINNLHLLQRSRSGVSVHVNWNTTLHAHVETSRISLLPQSKVEDLIQSLLVQERETLSKYDRKHGETGSTMDGNAVAPLQSSSRAFNS